MKIDYLARDAVLRVGEVSEVAGRKIYVLVDREKNVSELLFDDSVLRNISVGSFIEIRKGFLSLIGKVDGEKIEELPPSRFGGPKVDTDRNRRHLAISLVGYITNRNEFQGGTKELPLIGNEAFIVTHDKLALIHNLANNSEASIEIATTGTDDIKLPFPIDGLFNSHIAIFGNTGSGKSNTLAILYQELCKALRNRNEQAFVQHTQFLLFDFNGEYAGPDCITTHKKVYNLSTRDNNGDKIPLPEESLLDLELVSILADATEKTQKPFLRRAISFCRHVYAKAPNDPEGYFRNILKQKIMLILQMSDKIRVDLLFDYLRELLPDTDANGNLVDLTQNLEWHNNAAEYILNNVHYLKQSPAQIPNTFVYLHADNFSFGGDILSKLICFLYLQIITDVLSNRAQNEHIAPAINKLKSKKPDIEKIFDTTGNAGFWDGNFVVVNLDDVNLEMKKTIPLLISKKVYADHKRQANSRSLTIIIDEAHNVLSTESFREAESWKDYRLETFEEIVKEGRKFGVFVTIASQRPNDISPTITSQAHNYFIHRLINHKDLATIASAVSYIDRLTEESIPTLPTGTCIFSGTVSQMPLKIMVKRLDDIAQPRSQTLQFRDIIPELAEEAGMTD